MKGYFFFIVAFLLSGCANVSTRITSFKDPDYRNFAFNKILLYVNSDNLNYTLQYEDFLKESFSKVGIDAKQSYLLFPPTRQYSDSTKVQILLKNKIDGYLIISPKAIGYTEIDLPTYTYTKIYGTASTIANKTKLNMQSNSVSYNNKMSEPYADFDIQLIDANTGRIAWISSFQNDGSGFSSMQKVISAFGDNVALTLVKDTLITPDFVNNQDFLYNIKPYDRVYLKTKNNIEYTGNFDSVIEENGHILGVKIKGYSLDYEISVKEIEILQVL